MKEVQVLKYTKKARGGCFFSLLPKYIFVGREEIHELMREEEVEFKDCEVLEIELLSVLKTVEVESKSVELLNRIINNGGFVKYINYLESRFS